VVIRGLRYATAAGVVTALATMAKRRRSGGRYGNLGDGHHSRTFAGYRITEPKKHIRNGHCEVSSSRRSRATRTSAASALRC